MLQETAFSLLKSGENIFLTGPAGSGKTHLLNRYIRYLRAREVPLAITASTGIAATHISGMTIHSWCGLGIRDTLAAHDLTAIARRKAVRTRISETRVLIIDEISMLSMQSLQCIDQILRHFKIRSAPFGGMQVVLSGDFFQLPPVARNALPAREKLAFMAPIWVDAKLTPCYLHESHRHIDDRLLQLLNGIRNADDVDDCDALLKEKLRKARADAADANAIRLYTHNLDVDAANTQRLAELPGALQTFSAKKFGATTLVESLQKSVLAPPTLQLKLHARVMFVKNNPEEKYMNGTLGEVIEFTDDGLPVVKTAAQPRITARATDWTVTNEQGAAIATYNQIPLRLAWAITVHKSQGMTLERAVVDLTKTFEPGQGYVALSRVKTWDGLTLLGCNARAVAVEPLVQKADRRFQVLSATAETRVLAREDAELQTDFARHIKTCGGTTDPARIAQNEQEMTAAPRAQRMQGAAKIDTYAATKKLIQDRKSLAEIIAARGFKEVTILEHMEKLLHDDPKLDISYLQPPPPTIAAVRDAIYACKLRAADEDYDRYGRFKLTPLYRKLDGKIAYAQIQLARMFIPEATDATRAAPADKNK